MTYRTTIYFQCAAMLALVLAPGSSESGNDQFSTQSIRVEAGISDDYVFELVLSNDGEDELTVYDNQFKPPILKLVVVDSYGDVVPRVAWIGDMGVKPEVIQPKSLKAFELNLPSWYPEMPGLAKSECLVLFWSIELRPEEVLSSMFFGGALKLNCDK